MRLHARALLILFYYINVLIMLLSSRHRASVTLYLCLKEDVKKEPTFAPKKYK